MNKLNNKGFTLIEILAVVAMITLMSLIAVPSVLSTINKGKDSSYEMLMENINTASKSLFEEIEYMDGSIYNYNVDGTKGNKIEIKQEENNKIIEINLQTLVKNGFLEGSTNKEILDPKTNKNIGDCQIKIIKKNDDFKVSYIIENVSTNDYCPSSDDYSLKKENKKEENESSVQEESNESLQNERLLSTKKRGSYIKYSETNEWRVAYIVDGRAHIISAGITEEINTVSGGITSYTEVIEDNISIDLDSSTYYSDSYTFNNSNGKFILNYPDVIDMEKIDISSDTPLYTCNYQNSYSSCDIMYEIYEMIDDKTGLASKHTVRTTQSGGTATNSVTHISNLNKKALNYCNIIYVEGGICNNETTWALNDSDYKLISGMELTNDKCFGVSATGKCSLEDSKLINNELFYWIAKESDNSNYTYIWDANYNVVSRRDSSVSLGLRPVIKLDKNIVVTGGEGTKDNPYTIEKK